MPSPLLEETDATVTLDPDGCPAGEDEVAYQFRATLLVTTHILQDLTRRIEAGERLHPVVTQDDIDELEAAFEVGNEIIQRDDWEAVKRDFSTLDDETLANVHATLGNVAPHLGLELDVSDLVGTGGDD